MTTIAPPNPDRPASESNDRRATERASLFDHPHWDRFTVTSDGRPSGLRLVQTGPRSFRLDCEVRYHGPLGLEELGLGREAEDCLRTVDADTLPHTDLASVPAPFRWWSNTYGVHSPAALIHDRFIGEPAEGDPGRPDGVTERHIDRYFRFMLQASGVPFFRRWLMWAAVALRTRMTDWLGRASIAGWVVLTVGWWMLAAASALDGRWWSAAGAVALLVPTAALWGRQIGAGLIMGTVGLLLLLPPSVMSVPFLLLYVFFEALGKQASRSYRYLTSDTERAGPS